MSVIIEILYITNALHEEDTSDDQEKKRMLGYLLKYKIGVGISALLFLIMATLLFSTVYRAI